MPSETLTNPALPMLARSHTSFSFQFYGPSWASVMVALELLCGTLASVTSCGRELVTPASVRVLCPSLVMITPFDAPLLQTANVHWGQQ